MDKKVLARVKNTLRELSIQTPEYTLALNKVKTKKLIGKYKNGKDKYRVHYICEFCFKDYLREDVQVDHILEVGQCASVDALLEWIKRLFCDASGFQVLCTRCHLGKTNEFMNSIRLGTIYL